MAEHKLAILVSAVGAAKAAKELKGVDLAVSKIGARAGKGLRTATSNLLKLGAAGAAVGAGLVAVNVKSGVQSLATLESAVSKVQGALVNMGNAGTVTGAQVASWANEIEASTQAAFDDKDITAATANLIRYGRIGPKLLKPAMVVMTDMAAKTGDVESASKALAKALADPTKATRILKDAGVVLTKAEQKQINAWVESGNRAKAQAYLLQLVAKNTKGAAAAMNGPWQDAMNTMGDATEDAQRALAIGFMPVIKRAAEWIKGVLADPATLSNIESFGTSMAGAFDEAITFAQKVPWQSIGNGLKTAADWAGKLFDAFRSMPPEMQATIIALGGMEKLSGGAVSGVIGELGKGLIKGVLGMTAGVVNINAAVVNGPGGTGGPGTTPGTQPGTSGGGMSDILRNIGLILGGVGISQAASQGAVSAYNAERPGANATSVYGVSDAMLKELVGVQKGNTSAVKALSAAINPTVKNDPTGFRNSTASKNLEQYAADTKSETIGVRKGVEGTKQQQAASIVAFRSGERTSAVGLSTVASTTRSGTSMMAAVQSSSASRIVGAVQAAGKPTVNVYVNVPGANVRYGSSNGSSGGHNGGSGNSGVISKPR